MNHLIIVNGDEWMTVEGRITAKGKSKNLLETLGGSEHRFFWPSDMGCAFDMPLKKGGRIMAMYLVPKMRRVTAEDEDEAPMAFDIIWPHSYVVFRFSAKETIHSAYAIIAKKPLKSLSDPVAPLPLPNIHIGDEDDSLICIGSPLPPMKDHELKENIDSFFGQFIARPFNNDLWETDYLPKELWDIGSHSPPGKSCGCKSTLYCELKCWHIASQKLGAVGMMKLKWNWDDFSFGELLDFVQTGQFERDRDDYDESEDKTKSSAQDIADRLIRINR